MKDSQPTRCEVALMIATLFVVLLSLAAVIAGVISAENDWPSCVPIGGTLSGHRLRCQLHSNREGDKMMADGTWLVDAKDIYQHVYMECQPDQHAETQVREEL